jgi:hypothetical protein
MLFWSIFEEKPLFMPRANGRLRGALKTPGWFLTPKNFLLDKLPWFPMVLVTVGGCFALHNASCVYLRAGGNMQF